MTYTEKKIGETFPYNGDTIIVVESPKIISIDKIPDSCKICCFKDTEQCGIVKCIALFRSDKKNVYYQKVITK